jgi:hypothetical protein
MTKVILEKLHFYSNDLCFTLIAITIIIFMKPTSQPSRQPTGQPSKQPSMQPSSQPTDHVRFTNSCYLCIDI